MPPAQAMGAASDALGRRRQSVRVAALQDVPKRQPENAQVEPERPVVDVEQVVFYTARNVGVAAQVVDLRPAGNAALDQMLLHVAGNALPELLDKLRPLGPRADERHLAPQ